jgi:Na+-driven multidrug efflux pump
MSPQRSKAKPRHVISQVIVPLGICAAVQALRGLTPADIWLAILAGHMTRSALSVIRFRQGRWRGILVDIGH